MLTPGSIASVVEMKNDFFIDEGEDTMLDRIIELLEVLPTPPPEPPPSTE